LQLRAANADLLTANADLLIANADLRAANVELGSHATLLQEQMFRLKLKAALPARVSADANKIISDTLHDVQ
jgi:hypothetical protein